MKIKNHFRHLNFTGFLLLQGFLCTMALYGQDAPRRNAGLLSSSPNVQASIDVSSNIYDGRSSINLPVCNLTCGSLAMPVSLQYSNNGFVLSRDAGWVGLGWNIAVGGSISRTVQGVVDNTRQSGYNYGQYSMGDSLFQVDNTNFLKGCYSTDSLQTYDVAPDIFSFNFNGYSGDFYWYNGKSYIRSYDKQLKISWPSQDMDIDIVTGDGVAYTFAAVASEVIRFIPSNSDGLRSYKNAWNLTRIVSANKADTILLNYNSFNWRQTPLPYYQNWILGTTYFPGYEDVFIPASPTPNITARVLSSIECRVSRIDFVLNPTPRIDVDDNYPSLKEIKMTDKITGKVIKQHLFDYDYFGRTGIHPIISSWLKLTSFHSVNVEDSTDQQSYKFVYNDALTYIDGSKGHGTCDFWGFYNSGWNSFIMEQRTPNFSLCSATALDTVFYPSGTYTKFEYELNDYYASSTDKRNPGPGIRVKSIAQYLPNLSIPATKKEYVYNNDDTTASSGTLVNAVNNTGLPYSVDPDVFNAFVTNSNSPGEGLRRNVFYYKKVSEIVSDGSEVHRSDFYFNSFSEISSDIELIKKVDYDYNINSEAFTPVSVSTSDYGIVEDTSFMIIAPYVLSAYVDSNPFFRYTYNYTYHFEPVYWKYATTVRNVQYDVNNDSTFTSTHFYYNALRNLDSTVETYPDSRKYITKYKYPDDYSSGLTGNMVSNNFISPFIEKQVWLQKDNSAELLIGGEIAEYDPYTFKLFKTYAFETASPVSALNNETKSGGKYNTLLSDSRYVLKTEYTHDWYGNLIAMKSSNDADVAYVYDYKRSMPVAEIVNASEGVAFTSFEADGFGGWSLSSSTLDYVNSFTGSRSYNLSNGSISASVPASGNFYIVSYWSKVGVYSVAGSAGYISGTNHFGTGWTYFEHTVTGVTTVSISGSGNIDEVRLYPKNAQMTSFTYFPLIGLNSTNDPSNKVTFYQYDGFNRILAIKNADKQIVKAYEYQMNQATTYYNDTVSATFIKACPCGQVGSSYTYTVNANTYLSHSGKIDANQRAKNDIIANGQNAANTGGSCSDIICGGVDKKIVNCVCETGVKTCTSSVWKPVNQKYLVTYHYAWSDGSYSVNYTELRQYPCYE